MNGNNAPLALQISLAEVTDGLLLHLKEGTAEGANATYVSDGQIDRIR
jgi:hypothetical protein